MSDKRDRHPAFNKAFCENLKKVPGAASAGGMGQLEALVVKWVDDASGEPDGPKPCECDHCVALRQCANELKEVLDSLHAQQPAPQSGVHDLCPWCGRTQVECCADLPQPGSGEKVGTQSEDYPWTLETMAIINKLTPDVKDKAFDPDWFLLRQRFEQFEAGAVQQKGGEALREANSAPKLGLSIPKLVERYGVEFCMNAIEAALDV